MIKKFIRKLPNGRLVIFVVIILSIIALFYNLKALFIAAVVNGRPITRFSLDRQLEKQVGKQVLENEISKTLILQEAKRQNIKITDKEIEAKVGEIEKNIESQGAKLETILENQGQSLEDLKEQVKIQLIVEKILARDVIISEEELSDYFEKNKSYFPQDATLESVESDLEKELYQQKMGEKFQSWLNELKQKSKIYYFLKL